MMSENCQWVGKNLLCKKDIIEKGKEIVITPEPVMALT